MIKPCSRKQDTRLLCCINACHFVALGGYGGFEHLVGYIAGDDCGAGGMADIRALNALDVLKRLFDRRFAVRAQALSHVLQRPK